MERRFFILSSLAGLIAPSAPSCQPQQSADPVGAIIGEAGAPAPVDNGFDNWLAGFRSRALAAGWPADLLDRELGGLTADPRVVTLDTRQPELSRPVGDYIKGVVSEERVATGRRRREELTFLPAVEERFGVPREILIAVWAMESAFGAVQGDFDVIRSVASLAADGRRRAFAEAQIYAALKMIAEGHATRAQMKGSWAGAMGQTQFIPETYLNTAVDGDGDGRRDIWASNHDALASAANLLAKEGWRKGEGWAREVTLPQGFDYSLAEGPRHAPAWWAGQGAVPADGYSWSEADARAEAGLVLPSGAAGPAFLVLPNHFVIRKYNNSTSYALGIGLLADRIGGKPPLVTPWPYEVGLTSADRIGAQTALAKLGFDPGAPDGVIGVNTRAALRAWQKARGLPADGYLSVDLVRRLVAEAGGI